MIEPSLDTALRLLQLIGLSLPAVALYLMVLVEAHMTTRRVTGAKMEPAEGKDWGDNHYTFKPDRYTARLTDAASQLDFFTALASLTGFLLSALSLGLFVVLGFWFAYFVGVSLLLIAILIFAISCLFLLHVSYQSVWQED